MRLSADSEDPGYAEYHHALARGQRPVITLDGEEVRRCITADEEEGFVLACVLDLKGNLQVDPRVRDRVWMEERRGAVKITLETVQ